MKHRLTAVLAGLVLATAGSAQVAPTFPQLGLPGVPREAQLPPPPASTPVSVHEARWLGIGYPRPGYHLIRPLNAQLCLAVRQGGVFERTHMALAPCDPNDRNQLFAVLPKGSYHTVRPATAIVKDRLLECATVARGVVLGPARIDLLPCEHEASKPAWAEVGVYDQQVTFEWSADQSAYRIKLPMPSETGECWAMRGGGGGAGTDVIRWGCNGKADQWFNLTWLRPLEPVVETELLRMEGWMSSPDGLRRPFAAHGFSLGGLDYAAFETHEDSGRYCSLRCVESPECKAYMWTSRSYEAYLGPEGKTAPMCHLKSSVGTPLNRGQAYYGKVISGVIRS